MQTCLEICRIPARFRGWIPSLCRASEYDLRAEGKTVFMWQNTGKTPPGCSLERSNSSPENQHAFSFFHCLYFLSCTGQNCSDIITEAIQRHSARIEKADTPAPALQARRFSARFAVSYVCFACSESFRTPPSVSQQRQRKGKAASSALLYHAAEKSARRSAQPQKSKNPAPRLSAGKTVNSNFLEQA